MVPPAVKASPIQVPIYISNGDYSPNRYTIYAGINGGALLPYNFDTGAPNFFTVVGAQGGTATANFTFAQSPTYNYFIDPVTVTLGSVDQIPMVTTGTVNVAAVVSISENNNPPQPTTGHILSDGTYGDFGAGLYGNSTLATILSQVPLSPGLQTGWLIDVAGKSGGNGTLTIGLTTEMIQSAKQSPGAITMFMDKSGQQIPTPNGPVDGYNKAQVGNTTVTLTNGSTTISKTLPTVFDTGGGPNVVIYDEDFHPADGGAVDISYGSSTFVSYNGTTPWGGNVTVGSGATGGERVNPGGATIFENYQVLFHLPGNPSDPGELILVPLPEPSVGLLLGLGFLLLMLLARGARARGLVAALTLALCPAGYSQLNIPLELVTITGSDGNVSHKLGIWVGLGGGPQRRYEFDTGGPGFWAGYSQNLNAGVDQWWGSFTQTGQTANTTYTSGVQYDANIVTTSIQIYGNGTSSTPLLDTGSQAISVAQIQSATQNSTNIYGPIQDDQAFLQGHFWGDFGASLMPAISGSTVLYGVLPQIPTADLPGSNLQSGFIVNTGGFESHHPQLILGITPEANSSFNIQAPMNPAAGYTYPTTGVQAFEEAVVTGTMTLSREGETTGPLTAPLILDTGATTASIHPGGVITEAALANYLQENGKHLLHGTEVVFELSGAPGYDSLIATFVAGATTGLNQFGVNSESQNPDAVNLGLLGFNAYETMFNLTTGRVGFHPIPEPSGGIYLLPAACFAALAFVFRRVFFAGRVSSKS